MSRKNNGGSAFPTTVWYYEGMSVRDYFAAKALPLTLKCSSAEINKGESVAQMFARKAYEVADAMLAEREKGDAK